MSVKLKIKARVFHDPLVSLNFEGFDPQFFLNDPQFFFCLPSLIHMTGVIVTPSTESCGKSVKSFRTHTILKMTMDMAQRFVCIGSFYQVRTCGQFLGFLSPVPTQPLFPKPLTTFLTCKNSLKEISLKPCTEHTTSRSRVRYHTLLGECNTILSAYTLHRHLG